MPKLLRWIMGAPVRRSLRQAVERSHRGSIDWASPSLSRTVAHAENKKGALPGIEHQTYCLGVCASNQLS